MIPHLDGPHRPPVDWFRVAHTILISAFFAFLLGVWCGYWIAEGKREYEARRFGYPDWLPKERALKLERYHGEGHLKITNINAQIKRDGRWIVVERREM